MSKKGGVSRKVELKYVLIIILGRIVNKAKSSLIFVNFIPASVLFCKLLRQIIEKCREI